jgi:hypothetical protein
MFAALALALAFQSVTVRAGGGQDQKSDSARRAAMRDSIRVESIMREARNRSREPRRVPVTPELERTAFRDSAARTLLLRAREARMLQDSTLLAYDATAYQRISAGLGFRAIGRDRLLFRSENASRVQWSRTNGVLIDLKGRRAVVPMAEQEAQREVAVETDQMTPIPYFPGREALWVGSGMARAEVDERELVHPIAIGAEAYYHYSAGDSLTITLSDGKVIRLRELRIEPRRPEWRFSVGSFWFDQERGQLVRAVYRFAAPMNIWAVAEEEARREGNRDDEVPGWVKGMLSPMEANLEAVTIEYGLYGGRYWLPRTQYAEGYAKAGFMRVPFKMEESFRYASVNGTDSVPPVPRAIGLRAIRDSLFPDSASWRDLSPEERRERYRRIAQVDSGVRSERRRQREEDCRTKGYHTDVEQRYDRTVRATVRVPCSDSVLAHSPALPPSIYDAGEELFGVTERNELLKALDFSLQPVWAPMPIELTYGLAQTRYNRVEGLSTGLRATQQLGRGYSWDAGARIGTSDVSVYGELGVSRTNGRHVYRLGGYRRLGVANGDWGSPLSFGGSLGALLYGRDEGYYYRASGVELERSLARGGGLTSRLFLERQAPAMWNTRFNVSRAMGGGTEFLPNIAAEKATVAGLALRTQLNRGLDPVGWRLFADARAEGGWFLDRARADSAEDAYTRIAGELTVSRGLGGNVAAALTAGAGYSSGATVQRGFFLGGAQTVRGQLLGTGAGDAYWLGRLELGRALGVVRPVAFGDVGWAGPWSQRTHPGRPISGAGVGASLLDGLVRFDVARGIYPRTKLRLDLYVEARF